MTTSKLNNPGIIYFVQEKDLLGYSTPNYVKIGLVKENEIGRSGEDRKDEHQTGNPDLFILLTQLKLKQVYLN